VGLVSRTHVVPISASQDTAGPMTQSVHDAALLLTAIAGADPTDPATAEAEKYATDFTVGLAEASLAGKRIGVLREAVGNNSSVKALFEASLADLRRAGAELVELDFEPDEDMGEAEFAVFLFELREGLAAYLASSPADIPVRTIDDVIAFNKANAADELRWFGQNIFEMSAGASDRAAYEEARTKSSRLAGADGIDRLLAEHDLDLLVAPTTGPAWSTDLVNGDNYDGSIGAGSLAAVAGYPHLTVPMGAVEGLPVGLSLMSGKWADHAVLLAGAAYERARSATLAVPSFEPWTPGSSR
jgi:amidase